MTRYPPRIYTIVLNYMRSDDTLRCLASLRASTYRNQFLVVVDNGSGPDSRRELADGLGSVPLIQSGENLGFAGGNNLGIAHALDRGADYVWILNPDTVVEEGTLEWLVRAMSRFPEGGIVGSRILRGDDGAIVLFNGGRIDWSRGGKPVLPGMGKPEASMPPARVTPIDYATGASMLVRRRLFEEIGLLPERYFLYFEETDFNTRALRAGWKVLLEPRSRVMHFRRSWANVPSPYYVYYFVRNRILFGRTFSTAPTDAIVDDLQEAIASWRTKVARKGPAIAAAFERVVADALADGTATRDGQRPAYNAPRWEDLSDV